MGKDSGGVYAVTPEEIARLDGPLDDVHRVIEELKTLPVGAWRKIVAGPDAARKRKRIGTYASRCGLYIQTRLNEGWIYIRRMEAPVRKKRARA